MRPVGARRPVIVGIVLLCVVLLPIGIAVASWLTSGVKVVVANNTDAAVKNLEIEFTGGVIAIPSINPGTVYRTRVKPTSESHLELRFTDASGKERREVIGVYFEPRHYRGTIFIELAPDGSVRWEDTIRLSVW